MTTNRAAPRSRVLLFGLLGGGLLLLGLCCAGIGVGGYFALRGVPGNPAKAIAAAMDTDPEKVIIGKWRFDGDYGNLTTGGQVPTFEFKEGGILNAYYENNPIVRCDNGKWQTVGKTGNSITVKMSYDYIVGKEGTRTMQMNETFTVVSRDQLHKAVFDQFGETHGGQRYKRI